MSRNRYTKDYRLLETVDERGRIRTETEYIGAEYVLSGNGEENRRALRLALSLCGASWLCFIVPLLVKSTASLTMYVMLPYLFAALPLWLLSSTLLRLRRAGDRLDHRMADQVNERLPACCLWITLLPAAALIGELIALIAVKGPFHPGDAVFLVCAAGLIACSRFCALVCRSLRAENK